MKQRRRNWRGIGAIVRKDLMVVRETKGVSIPMIVIPFLVLVVIPSMATFAPLLRQMPVSLLAGVNVFLEQAPGNIRTEFARYNEVQSIVVLSLGYFMAPMYLILPHMVASVIAADSFAGEKERKTLEALLHTPTTDGELLLAKLLSAWLPAMVIAWGGFLLYAVVVNVAAWPTMGQVFFPNAMWSVLAVWLAPAVAGLGLSATVLISSRAKGFQDAYQLGVVVILPVLFLAVAQMSGAVFIDVGLVFVLGVILWIVDAVLLGLGARTFRRDVLATRL
jgi:ABC-type transport system involved in multi-copper enzyme maturation permease subunit